MEQEMQKDLENAQTLIDLDILGGPRVGVPEEERGLQKALAQVPKADQRTFAEAEVVKIEAAKVAEK